MEPPPPNHCDNVNPGEALSDSNAVNGLHTQLVDANPSKVDANPSEVDARPSEVDAKPIIVVPGKGPGDPIVIPTEADSSHYVLEGAKKVFIFNQKTFASRLQLNPRRGTDVDVKSIEATFKALHWDIEVHNDLTVAQIRDIILKQIQLSECNWAALALFILSHGEDNGTVFAADYPFRVDHDILVNLAADKCPGLAGKPKLVFVQACQGQATDPGSSVRADERRRRHTSTDNSTQAYKIPNYSDFLIFQASFWDHFSFRSTETGSWFIQALCAAIDSSEMDESLMDVLLSVSRNVAINKESNVPGKNHLDKKKQVPLLYSTMLRKMYLKSPQYETELSPAGEAAVSRAIVDVRITERDNLSGSQRSLPLKKDKIREKDCSCM